MAGNLVVRYEKSEPAHLPGRLGRCTDACCLSRRSLASPVSAQFVTRGVQVSARASFCRGGGGLHVELVTCVGGD